MHGIIAVHPANVFRPWNAHLALHGFESAAIAQPSSEQTQIHVSVVHRQIRDLAQQHRQIERRAVKRHKEVILPQRFREPASVQRFTVDE
jgi:hypothetical protein